MMEKEDQNQEEIRFGEIYKAIKVLSDGLVSQKGAMEKLEGLMGALGERQDGLQKRMDEANGKSLLTNPELIDELESHSAQVTSLALQTEKLSKLRSEGKVSDAIYSELYWDIEKKVEESRGERVKIAGSARSRIGEVNSEVGELKYRLERLEVRRALDFVTEEKYSASKEELMKKIGENEEAMILIAKLMSASEEAFKKIDVCMPEPPEVPERPELPERQEEQRAESASTKARTQIVRDPKPLFRPISKVALLPPQAIPQSIPQAQPKEASSRPLTAVARAGEERRVGGELICPKCKGANQREAFFCIVCGTRIGASGSGTEKKVPATVKVEEKKEVPIRVVRENLKPILGIKKCHKCGMENLSVASFCYHCNASLSNNEAPNNPQ